MEDLVTTSIQLLLFVSFFFQKLFTITFLDGTSTNKTEYLNPETNDWVTVTDAYKGHKMFSTISYHNQIYVFGGEQEIVSRMHNFFGKV